MEQFSALVGVYMQRQKVVGFLGISCKLPLVVGSCDTSLRVTANAPLDQKKINDPLMLQNMSISRLKKTSVGQLQQILRRKKKFT